MFTIIITVTIHDINSIINIIAKILKKGESLYTILVISFFILLSFLTAAVLTRCFYPSDKNDFSQIESKEKSDNTTISEKYSYFIFLSVFLIFLAQLLFVFLFAAAFDKLLYFIFGETAFFIIVVVLSILYALKMSVLRHDENYRRL